MKQEKEKIDWFRLLMWGFWGAIAISVYVTEGFDIKTKVILYLIVILGLQINSIK